MNTNYDSALKKWVSSVRDMIEKSYNNDMDRGYSWRVDLEIQSGSRFDKIVKSTACGDSSESRSVYAFIEKKTGDIYKPASWKAPAKHARGNIYAEDGGLKCADPYGIAYLRGL